LRSAQTVTSATQILLRRRVEIEICKNITLVKLEPQIARHSWSNERSVGPLA